MLIFWKKGIYKLASTYKNRIELRSITISFIFYKRQIQLWLFFTNTHVNTQHDNVLNIDSRAIINDIVWYYTLLEWTNRPTPNFRTICGSLLYSNIFRQLVCVSVSSMSNMVHLTKKINFLTRCAKIHSDIILKMWEKCEKKT